MTDQTYDDILDRQWDDVPTEKLLPTGHFRLRARNATYMPPKEAGKSGRVLFFYAPVEPMDDVSTAELEELGADYDITSNQVTWQAWIQQGRDWDAVRKHLALHGINTEGMTVKESLRAVKDAEVVAYVDTESFVRGGEEVQQNRASQFTAIE